jgi:hypothetical protein
MINIIDFGRAINDLQEFFNEQEKLDAVLKVISPSGTGICEFGNHFVDRYIHLLSLSVNDESDWVSWHVFENDFGRKKLSVKVNGKNHIIEDAKHLYIFALLK